MNRRRIESFLIIGAEELDAARRLQTPLPRQAEYLLQQTVEKLLRAVLEVEQIAGGVGHGLAELAHRLPGDHPLRDRFKSFDHLSAASTMYRYPTAGGRIANISSDAVAEELERVETLDVEARAYVTERLKSARAPDNS